MRHHLAVLLFALSVPAAPLGALTYEEAEKAMLETNPQALAASRDLDAARLKLSAARAALYPALSGEASYSRYGSQGVPAADSYSYGFSASQPLFSPGLSASARSAAAGVESAQAAYAAAASSLRYALRSAFADILNSRETIKLSEETLKRRSENLELIRLKYQAGRENKAALLETEASLKTAVWQHERYKNALRLQERKLNRLLGRTAREAVNDLRAPQLPEPPEDFGAVSGALERHPSLRSARAALASALASADGARSSALPEASASGSYKWRGSGWPASADAWSLGASLSLPVFAWGRYSSGTGSARARAASAEQDLKNASDEVYIGAEDAFLSWREARSYLDAAKSSLDAAGARAWLVRKQYLAGQSSYFEWRSVEEQLIAEQNQYLSAGRALAVAYAAFLKASGE